MEFHKLPIYIYGLYDSSKICHYVGQTFNVPSREHNHLKGYKARFKSLKLKLRIIRKTDSENSSRLEKQIGNAYKRMGQATASKVFYRFKRNVQCNNPIYVEGYALPFASAGHVACFFGCSPVTVANNIGGTIWNKDGEAIMISRKPIHFTYQI